MRGEGEEEEGRRGGRKEGGSVSVGESWMGWARGGPLGGTPAHLEAG